MDKDIMKNDKVVTEGVQWKFIDHRQPAEINKDGRSLSEHRKCPNGHYMFISSYRSFSYGKEEIIKCPECGVTALEWKPFWVREEIRPYTPKTEEAKPTTYIDEAGEKLKDKYYSEGYRQGYAEGLENGKGINREEIRDAE